MLELDREHRHTQHVASLPVFAGWPPQALAETLVEQRVRAGGWEFRARLADTQHPVGNLVLLHGFAETSAVWVPLMQGAAALGYRSVAFDQRGYSPGARPADAAHYDLANLAADVAAVAAAVGFNDYHVVGKGAGGRVAWALLASAPEPIISLTTINAPYPKPGTGLGVGYRRWLSLPWLPEGVLAGGDFGALRASLWQAPPGAVAEYAAVLREPGALHAALAWYRAPPPTSRATPRVPPSLLIWGTHARNVRAADLTRHRGRLGPRATELELEGGAGLLQRHPELISSAVLRQVQQANAAPPKRPRPTKAAP